MRGAHSSCTDRHCSSVLTPSLQSFYLAERRGPDGEILVGCPPPPPPALPLTPYTCLLFIDDRAKQGKIANHRSLFLQKHPTEICTAAKLLGRLCPLFLRSAHFSQSSLIRADACFKCYAVCCISFLPLCIGAQKICLQNKHGFSRCPTFTLSHMPRTLSFVLPFCSHVAFFYFQN